jgi:uncharacterized protein (TIGR02246 family)
MVRGITKERTMSTQSGVTLGPSGRLARSRAALTEALGGQLTADERREIATIPKRYVEHALADDRGAVAILYHPEAIQMMPDAPAAQGRDAIRTALARQLGSEGGFRLVEFIVDITEAKLLGEITYVRAHYRLVVEPLGTDEGCVRQEGPYVNLLRQDADGTWRIWHQFVGRAHPSNAPDMR